jgi:hypothetical protein
MSERGLTVRDHEALSRALLAARARLAQTAAQVHADCPRRLMGPILKSLEAAIRAVDQARDRLAGVVPQEHPHLHPALAKRLYYPSDGGGKESP